MNKLYDGHGRGGKSRLLEAYYLGLSPKPEAALTTLKNHITDWVIDWDETAEFTERQVEYLLERKEVRGEWVITN